MHGYRMLQGTLIPHSLPIVINQLGFCPLGKLRKKIKSPLSLSLSHAETPTEATRSLVVQRVYEKRQGERELRFLEMPAAQNILIA